MPQDVRGFLQSEAGQVLAGFAVLLVGVVLYVLHQVNEGQTVITTGVVIITRAQGTTTK